jgi:hypothetical protein
MTEKVVPLMILKNDYFSIILVSFIVKPVDVDATTGLCLASLYLLSLAHLLLGRHNIR